MPDRKFSAASQYRYGFNGKEKNNEISGEVKNYDYGARIYDPRLGRFYSIDLKAEKYTSYSPYHFGLNNPIYCLDIDGNDIIGLLSLLYKNNFPNRINVLSLINSNTAFQKLTSNFAKGGMYDKNKIDLVYSNYGGSQGIVHKQGSYEKASGIVDGNIGRTEIFATVKGKKDPISFSQLSESDNKNIERWIVSVSTDQRLFSEGVVGTISHETSTHAISLGAFLNDYINGKKGSLSEAQKIYSVMIDKDKTDTKSTDDHKEIASNTGEFRTLNNSILNQFAKIQGATTPLNNEIQSTVLDNLNNSDKHPNNAYNYIVRFLNGMVSSYRKASDPPATQSTFYQESSNCRNNNSPLCVETPIQ